MPAIAEFDHDRHHRHLGSHLLSRRLPFPDWQGDILFVALKTGRLYHLTLDGDKVVTREILIDDEFGRLRDIAESP